VKAKKGIANQTKRSGIIEVLLNGGEKRGADPGKEGENEEEKTPGCIEKDH